MNAAAIAGIRPISKQCRTIINSKIPQQSKVLKWRACWRLRYLFTFNKPNSSTVSFCFILGENAIGNLQKTALDKNTAAVAWLLLIKVPSLIANALMEFAR